MKETNKDEKTCFFKFININNQEEEEEEYDEIKENQIEEILKLIKSQPDNADHYNELIELHPAQQCKFKLGDQDSDEEITMVDLYLKIIELEPTYPSVYFDLCSWLEFQSLGETVTLLNGKEFKLVELLLKELENDPDHIGCLLKLAASLDNYQDKIMVPILSKETNDIKHVEVNQIQIYNKVLELNPGMPIAIQEILEYCKYYGLSEFEMQDKEIVPIVDLISFLYCDGKENDLLTPTIYFDFIKSIKRTSYNANKFGNQEDNIVTAQSLSLEAINEFPEESIFYYYLAKSILHNNIEIEFNSASVNRLDIIVQLLTIDDTCSQYYYKLGEWLETREKTITFQNKQWSNIDLFIKSIELDSQAIKARKELVKYLRNDETIEINGESFTKVELIESILDAHQDETSQSSSISSNDTFAFNKLVEYYTELNDEEQVSIFNDELFVSIESRKLTLIKLIEKYPNIQCADQFYYNLLMDIEKDETIEINGTQFNQLSLALKVIELNPKKKYIFYKLSKILDDEMSTIKLLNGKKYNKKELLDQELIINPKKSKVYYSIGKIIDPKVNCIVSITLDSKYSKPYLKLAQELQNENIEFVNFKMINQQFTRKQLLVKYLELENPSVPTNPSTLNNHIAWYCLSLEMLTNDELIFGKSKQEILNFSKIQN